MIRLCPSFHVARNRDITGSKSGVQWKCKLVVPFELPYYPDVQMLHPDLYRTFLELEVKQQLAGESNYQFHLSLGGPKGQYSRVCDGGGQMVNVPRTSYF